MGQFSWKTADTNESIYNTASGRERTVFMLTPDNKPIREDGYEGYGVFGGIDAFVLLAQMNADFLKLREKGIVVDLDDDADESNPDFEKLRRIGISLDCGDFLEHRDSPEVLHVFEDGRDILDGEFFSGNYSEIIPKYGKSANEMIKSGELIPRQFNEVITFPLKFSFDEHADYHSLPASVNCPNQGFFEPDCDDDLSPSW